MKVDTDLLNFYHEKLSVAGTSIFHCNNTSFLLERALDVLCSVHVVQWYNTACRAVYYQWCWCGYLQAASKPGGWVGRLAHGAFMTNLHNEGSLKPHMSTPFTVNDLFIVFTVIKVTLYDKCMMFLPPLYYMLWIN